MLHAPFPHVSSAPYHLLHPLRLGTEPAVRDEPRRGRVPGLWDPRDGVHALWVLLLRRTEEHGRRCGEAQAHGGAEAQGSLLRFHHRQWGCLAPAFSSGVLWLKQSCCSLERPHRGVIRGLQLVRGALVVLRCGCPLQRTGSQQCGSRTQREILLWSLVSNTNVCSHERHAGGLLVPGLGKAAQFRASKETPGLSGVVRPAAGARPVPKRSRIRPCYCLCYYYCCCCY